MEMQRLSNCFIGIGEVKGAEFLLVKCSEKAYLYEVNTGVSKYYEVFVRKSKSNSLRDCFPTSKAFGVWAWTYSNLDSAIEKFNHLNLIK